MRNLHKAFLLIGLTSLVSCGRSAPVEKQKRTEAEPDVYAILQAAAESSVEKVSDLLRKNPALVNRQNDIGETPLSRAVGALYPKEELVKLLLERGANPNARRSAGSTPLHTAAGRGHRPIMVLLLAHGAEVNARDRHGRTPLNHATFHNRREVAELLIARGAEMNVFDAAGLGRVRRLRELLDRDSSLVRATDAGETPLHRAAMRCQKQAAQLLLSRGANRLAKDSGGNTPAEVARLKGCPELVELLRP